MAIFGKKIILTAIEQEDLPLLHQWANDSETNNLLGGWHFPVSLQDQQQWFNNLSVSSLNQRFAIRTHKKELIGTTNLVDINWKDRNAFHGMMLGDSKLRGKGYGVDTIMTIMRYAFEELGLQRLDTTIIAYNEISLNIYLKKCGWVMEGKQRNWYYRKNRFWDRIIAGITCQDYEKLVSKTKYWR